MILYTTTAPGNYKTTAFIKTYCTLRDYRHVEIRYGDHYPYIEVKFKDKSYDFALARAANLPHAIYSDSVYTHLESQGYFVIAVEGKNASYSYLSPFYTNKACPQIHLTFRQTKKGKAVCTYQNKRKIGRTDRDALEKLFPGTYRFGTLRDMFWILEEREKNIVIAFV